LWNFCGIAIINSVDADYTAILEALSQDKFRAKFHLSGNELAYLNDKGIEVIIEQARDLLGKRLAPKVIPNDGKQTPWRGHPLFIAQHATGTCCRGCLRKWHKIEKGRQLTDEEMDHILGIIRAWLAPYARTNAPRAAQSKPANTEPVQLKLFAE
jgi:predicted Fe-S protein YdhL (DUF1289 family)